MNDLIVICYLLFLGVANLGDRTYGTTLLLFVICYLLFLGVVFLGEQTCVTTLLLFVICYLLFLGWRIWVTGHVERPYCYLLFVICYFAGA